MNVPAFLNKTGQMIKQNSPEILTALAVSGVFTTSYLVAKASFEAAEVIKKDEAVSGTAEDFKERLKERTKLVWKLYVPAGASGTATIACIVGATRSSGRRTAAAVTAYSLTERAFSEYREKVVEQIGEQKEQKIRDEIAQDHISERPTSTREVIITSGGDVLCCELLTHRYFRSDMETLKRSQNEVNAQIFHSLHVTLDTFYDLIDISHTENSDIMGWDSDKLMELEFSTVLSENGEPCLAFSYNYLKTL